ncbi:hypothetical protein R1sor_012222 [Riccia sorocarpa]|uniref:SMP domain-containing protein n=1 Tax=Riccia sorocarpa TaxID=122646 RepID=A0ABD3I4F1_9MARC
MSSEQERRPAVNMDSERAPIGTTEETASKTEGVPILIMADQESKSAKKEESVGFEVPAGPVTIGEALEQVASKIGDKPISKGDARAIQSAEAIAAVSPSGVKGGPGGEALAAVDSKGVKEVPTFGDVLSNTTERLPQDKIVTPRDAARVVSAESRNTEGGRVRKDGVAATLQQAAAYNQNTGLLPGADGDPAQCPPTASHGQRRRV